MTTRGFIIMMVISMMLGQGVYLLIDNQNNVAFAESMKEEIGYTVEELEKMTEEELEEVLYNLKNKLGNEYLEDMENFLKDIDFEDMKAKSKELINYASSKIPDGKGKSEYIGGLLSVVDVLETDINLFDFIQKNTANVISQLCKFLTVDLLGVNQLKLFN